uniref:Uncharacterized protein n=1 Tax=Chromera velia CCMP2878 TaxID=1169474 RepID=A0A0G4GJW8_9ALVE|eukprot:Cvel_4807.t1-p1 / transcript=Cvel_4807.t1 / gene=Cvel_4807 / organism=Chromera_velia_CCMP2878 / gene_product=Acid-sensing ion channel 1, putative / transcript_product=Acid-sensing ion channel 1, putative / location=Cvel_scaffold215:60398-62639(-) / protein_length=528 / sequence_SO=supercontig / SO=protein_coding / is_pseudo=false
MPKSKPFLPFRQRDTEAHAFSAAYPSLEGGTRESHWAARGSTRPTAEEDGASLSDFPSSSTAAEPIDGRCTCTYVASTLETVKGHVKATTLHAFPRAVESEDASLCWKAFWVTLGFCCILGAVWFSVDSVKSYRRREHLTIVKSEFHPSLELPAVTICNSNPLRKNLQGKMEGYSDIAHFWSDAVSQEFEPTAEQLMEGCHERGGMIVPWRLTAKAFREEVMGDKGGPKIDDVLQSSIQISDDLSGCCWTLNAGPEILSQRIGHSSTLHLQIDLQPDEYFNPEAFPPTFRVAVHPHNEPPNMDDAFELGANMSHKIAVRKTVVTRLPEGNEGCVNDEKSLPLLPPFSLYSSESCIKACLGAARICKCSCRFQGTAGGLQDKLCSTLLLEHLLIPSGRKKKFNEDRPECVEYDETEAYAECQTTCKIPCKREVFTAQLKSASTPQPKQILTLVKSWTGNRQGSQGPAMSELTIGFESFNVEHHSATLATPLSTLFGNLGGNFSLFIGASLVSVIETALSMVDCLCVFFF